MTENEERHETLQRGQVLLVEDDDAVRRSLHLLLHSHGFDVRSYAGIGSLVADTGVATAKWLIADYLLSDGDGVGLLLALRQMGWNGRAILITAFPSDILRDSALAAGYDAVLEKPLRRHELIGALG